MGGEGRQVASCTVSVPGLGLEEEGHSVAIGAPQAGQEKATHSHTRNPNRKRKARPEAPEEASGSRVNGAGGQQGR